MHRQFLEASQMDAIIAYLGVLYPTQLLPDGQGICHDLHCQKKSVTSDSPELSFQLCEGLSACQAQLCLNNVNLQAEPLSKLF